MTAYLPPVIFGQEFDANGAPLAGGLLYTYVAGTTTPQATYTDAAGTVANTNPIVLDAAGRYSLRMGSGLIYKFVLKDALGVTLSTQDNVAGTDAPAAAVQANLTAFQALLADPFSGDANIGVKGALTGEVATTQHVVNANAIVNPVVRFACPTDGTSDCSTAVGLALTALGSYGTIEFPAGTFKMNIDLAGKRINFRGSGIGKTILQSYSPTGAVVTLGDNATWDIITFENMTICGPAGTVTAAGVQFGHAVYQSGDEYAGRVVFKNCKFLDLDKCISRLYGNLGVWIQNCTFENANYHLWTKGTTSPLMHGGAMYVKDTHFQVSKLASCYIDSPQTGTGHVVFEDCVHEFNYGFVFFVKNFNCVGPEPPIYVSNCWNEGNYSAASVTIDSVAYTPIYGNFTNTFGATFKLTPVGPMNLVNSNVLVKESNIDGITAGSGVPGAAACTLDAGSTLIIEDSEQDLSINMAYNRSAFRMNRNGCMSRVPHRSWYSKCWNGLATAMGKNDCTSAITYLGTGGGTTANVATDGVLGASSQDLTLPAAGLTCLFTAIAITATANRYQVYWATYKRISGAWPTLFDFSGGIGLSSNFPSSDEWVTVAGISKAATTGTCYPVIVSAGAGVIRLGGYGIAEFTTKQKALEFLESGVFPS